MICPHCGYDNVSGSKFCYRCGKPLPAETDQSGQPAGAGQPYQPEGPQTMYQPPQGQSSVPQPPANKISPPVPVLISVAGLLLVLVVVLSALLVTGHKKSAGAGHSFSTIDQLLEKSDKENGSKAGLLTDEDSDSVMVSQPFIDGSDSTADKGPEDDSDKKDEQEMEKAPESVQLSCGAQILKDAASADLSQYSVGDLNGIEQCPDLSSLIIKQGSLTDLGPLSKLTHLRNLVLNNVPVSDLDALTGLSSLTTLDIHDTQLSADAVKRFTDTRPDVQISGYTAFSYTGVIKDTSWDQAEAECEAAGGHLASIRSQDELNLIIDGISRAQDQSGVVLHYVWLGASSSSGSWQWVDGTPWTQLDGWYPGEPSGHDVDGTVEDKLCLWNIDDYGWTLNDQRNDLTGFNQVAGHMAYVLEKEELTGIKPQ